MPTPTSLWQKAFCSNRRPTFIFPIGLESRNLQRTSENTSNTIWSRSVSEQISTWLIEKSAVFSVLFPFDHVRPGNVSALSDLIVLPSFPQFDSNAVDSVGLLQFTGMKMSYRPTLQCFIVVNRGQCCIALLPMQSLYSVDMFVDAASL